MSDGAGPETSPPDGTRVSHYEYDLPDDRIAAFPTERRDGSRLMVVPRLEDGTGAAGSAAGTPADSPPDLPDDLGIRHLRFRELTGLMRSGDLLVVNESRVLAARLLGRRRGGGAGEVLLLRPVPEREAAPDARSVTEDDPRVWDAMVRPGRKLGPGKRLRVADDLEVEVLEVHDDGLRRVRLYTELPVLEALERHGHIPLPPYIERDDAEVDRDRYQTVYARVDGSVAAPTAGLHFTDELLSELESAGIERAAVTLHVGAGTFRPVDVDDPSEHPMHAEVYRVPEETAAAIRRCRGRGGRVWAVGTTVVRTLETMTRDGGEVRACAGSTDLFIRPPWRWGVVDGLVTNFHLPRSTLLMLVAARLGYARTMAAYRTAIREGYRFYSYGDAMVIPPEPFEVRR